MITAHAYSPRFFDELEAKTWRSASVIIPIVMELLGPESVLDIGCGVGVWLEAFRQAGVNRLCGMDGEWVPVERLRIPGELFTPVRLDGEWQVAGSWDLAVCLEVGEHLPARAARPLVQRLTAAAPAVLFSAAIPGQGGTNHINEQWPEYWKKLFLERGYVRLDPIRLRTWQNEQVAWFYQQNLFLYVSRERLAASPGLQEELQRAERQHLTLIHERVLSEVTSLRGLLAAFPRLLFAALRRRVQG